MQNLKQQKIAVLLGGTSAEREVSLNSGQAVLEALQTLGYNAHPIDPKFFPLIKLKDEGFERVFNVLHGRGGEDGSLQGLLEHLDIPCTGCGVLASALTMDKMRTKMLWKAFDLPVADMVCVSKAEIGSIDSEEIIKRLGLPVIVKPSLEGSSFGVTKVDSLEELKEAITFALKYDDIAIVEEWMSGGEYTVPILDKEVLPAIHIIPQGEIYDYEAKYNSDTTQYICPSNLTPKEEEELKQLVKKAYDIAGCEGWSRVDAMRDGKGNFQLMEVNTVPGMTSHSLFPKSAAQVGYSFEQLVEKILELSVK